jgi:hypothetical protein
VKMRHQTNGHRIDVKPDMEAMYASQGWHRVATPTKTTPTKTTAKKSTAAKPAKGKK